ncbi:ion transporter [Pararhodobacter sp.]|uniref:ion transporter n=1 Tax=Pararhodobacter sp. TaxID=2127056 RepID=UPI002AFEDBFE|nr:ion transporter [Pararhodobacter sp.]
MTLRDRVTNFLALPSVRYGILGVIVFNALILGLETSPGVMATAGAVIIALDTACLAVFVLELSLKIYAQRGGFFRSGWNLFDLTIVGIALVPGAHSFGVLRALRILRLLRVVSVAPALRRVVEGFVRAVPGMGSVFLLMAMIFYIGAVMATKLFAEAFPEWFGSLGASAYTLFQIMTLESWSMGIVRPVMAEFPSAWLFFIPFIMVTTFAVVNLLVGLIVNSMQEAHGQESDARTDVYRDEVIARLRAIEEKLAAKRD